jgi:Rhs element Vgr protein
MGNERVIETPAPSDRPTFTILVDDSEISREFHVTSITVTKLVNKIASAKIILLDGDPSAEDFTVSNTEIFVPGKSIEIRGGYHSQETSLFKGMIIKHGIKTRQGKPSCLIIECRHDAFKLSLFRRSAYYYELTDSDVFDELIGGYSISTDIESTSVQHNELVQFNCTDWDFLLSRAEVNGLLVFTNDEGIQIKKPDFSGDPALSLVYGATILEFDAEMDARDQIAGISSQSWDLANQEMVAGEADEPEVVVPGNIDAVSLAEVAGQEASVKRHTGMIPEEELKAWANAGLLKSRMSKVRGRVICTGYGEIQPGDLVELRGVGERFNGNAFVSGLRHEIGGGTWNTSIQFGLSPEWFVEKNDVSAVPAAGLLPAVSGLQIGVVTSLEGDPDGEDRVQVRMPVIESEEEGIWARVASLDAGENRGAFFRPEIDDEVVLGFLNDDPRDPIILGMLNSSAKPAPITASDDNHEKGFVTRSEMKVMFNDDTVSLTIETPNGNVITLSDDEGSIVLQDENNNTIAMDSDGIRIESAGDINIKASGDVNVEGTNTGIKASAQYKAEGSAGVEMSSSATAVVKGSLVQIN